MIEQRFAQIDGIEMHYVEAGRGPLVVLCHGFPECWYSWRAQIDALASAGYHVIAPDQRGYGQTEAPAPVEAYDLCYLAGDMVALVRSLGTEPATIVGHDWGAAVAWTSALLRPDLFHSVALLSVPYLAGLWGGPPPTSGMKLMCGDDKMFYQLYFQEPDQAEAELETDIRSSLVRMFTAAAGDAAPDKRWRFLFNRGETFMDSLPATDTLPPWLSEEDADYFTTQFSVSGFRGPLNWYRNLDRNAEVLAFLAGRLVEQPSLFIAGELDGVIQMYRDAFDSLESTMPALSKKVLIPGAGHWVQQERPAEVNRLLIEFLNANSGQNARAAG
jgi:pimeloyl-ACP methyl ester carboxylesterase